MDKIDLTSLIENKINELVEGYNELYKIVMRLEKIRQINNEEAIEETINKRRIAGYGEKPDTPRPKPAPRPLKR